MKSPLSTIKEEPVLPSHLEELKELPEDLGTSGRSPSLHETGGVLSRQDFSMVLNVERQVAALEPCGDIDQIDQQRVWCRSKVSDNTLKQINNQFLGAKLMNKGSDRQTSDQGTQQSIVGTGMTNGTDEGPDGLTKTEWTGTT